MRSTLPLAPISIAKIPCDSVLMAPLPTTRRLLREIAELSCDSSNLNPTFYASPVSDSNLYEWHFTLLGPPSPSPYAGGLFHGRITLPLQYPLKPPNFRFLTPSGRFEVNREICLSISGFHEETWMPAWGIRTALTALRSFMAEKGTAGQLGGLESSTEVRQRLARESRDWRCEACSGQTNEEIMIVWWEACRQKGIKVEEEMSVEELPEGLTMELKDLKSSATNVETSKTNVLEATLSETADDQTARLGLNDTAKLLPQTTPASPSQSLDITPARTDTKTRISAPLSPNSAQNLSMGPPQATMSSSSSIIAQSSPSTIQPRHRPLISSPSAVSASAQQSGPPSSAPVSQNASTSSASNARTTPSHPTAPTVDSRSADTTTTENPVRHDNSMIDGAIGAVVLALCLMILKRIFYPPSYPSMEDGHGNTSMH